MRNSLRTFELVFLQHVSHGREPRNIAVLLFNRQTDTLAMRFRADWEGFDSADLDIASGLIEDLFAKVHEGGASTLVSYLHTTLSTTLRVTDPELVTTDNVECELDVLQQQLTRHASSFTVPTSTTRGSHAKTLNWLFTPILAHSCGLLTVRHTGCVSSTGAIHRTGRAVSAIVLFLAAAVLSLQTRTPVIHTHQLRTAPAVISKAGPDMPLRAVTLPTHFSKADLQVGASAHRTLAKSTGRIKTQYRFIAPQSISQVPEVNTVTPPELLLVATEAEWPYHPIDTELPSPPADQPRRMLTFLQALAVPFRRLAHVLSD